jgi:hypothetical protein
MRKRQAASATVISSTAPMTADNPSDELRRVATAAFQ